MKKQFTVLLFLSFFGITNSQNLIETFESFSLATNSYYKDTNSLAFENQVAKFQHEWVNGNFPFWSAGFSYTNRYDSSTAGFTNLYGVIPYKGNNNSNTYVVAQDKGIIRLKSSNTIVRGFYYTNTTYAYKSMLLGDAFARKFGDTTGTGTGTTVAQGDYPDYFKLVVRGYKNGSLKSDSVEVYLADYRATAKTQDFIVDNWRYVNTSSLGSVDSLQFIMRSSVYNQWGMLTPGFFGIDDMETILENPVAVETFAQEPGLGVFPIPMQHQLVVQLSGKFEYVLTDGLNRFISAGFGTDRTLVDVSELPKGMYVIRCKQENRIIAKQLIK